jgi:hypothetical protein
MGGLLGRKGKSGKAFGAKRQQVLKSWKGPGVMGGCAAGPGRVFLRAGRKSAKAGSVSSRAARGSVGTGSAFSKIGSESAKAGSVFSKAGRELLKTGSDLSKAGSFSPKTGIVFGKGGRLSGR